MRAVQILIAILILSVAGEAPAQQTAFEAATVKRRIEPGGGFIGRQPGGRFTAQGVSLQDLIVFAYRLQPYQIVGGPAWLNKERWDISANGEPNTPDDVLIALQHLLTDRLALPSTAAPGALAPGDQPSLEPNGPRFLPPCKSSLD